MSWNIPPPYFTFSIPFQIYCSTAFTNSGGLWEFSSVPWDHACGICCCSYPALIPLTSRDIIHTEMHQDTNSTSREIKTVWKISFLSPASLSKPVRALFKQCLHPGMTKQAVRLPTTSQTRSLWEEFPGEHPKLDRAAVSGQKRKDLSLPAALRIHLFAPFFPSWKKGCRKIPFPFFFLSFLLWN